MPLLSRLIVSEAGRDWLLDYRLGRARFDRVRPLRLVSCDGGQLDEVQWSEERVLRLQEAAAQAEEETGQAMFEVVAHEAFGTIRYTEHARGWWAVPVIQKVEANVAIVEMKCDGRIWQMVSDEIARAVQRHWPARFDFEPVELEL